MFNIKCYKNGQIFKRLLLKQYLCQLTVQYYLTILYESQVILNDSKNNGGHAFGKNCHILFRKIVNCYVAVIKYISCRCC